MRWMLYLVVVTDRNEVWLYGEGSLQWLCGKPIRQHHIVTWVYQQNDNGSNTFINKDVSSKKHLAKYILGFAGREGVFYIMDDI